MGTGLGSVPIKVCMTGEVERIKGLIVCLMLKGFLDKRNEQHLAIHNLQVYILKTN